jgi:hypothetical protein
MDIIIILVVAAATLGAGLLGVYVQSRLPDEHKSDVVRGTIGQVAGLVTLLLALVMGTVIGVSYSFFATQKAGLETLSAQLLQLDMALAQYGPETQPARAKLKESTQRAYDAIWGGGEADPGLLRVGAPMAAMQELNAFLATLEPKTDVQKAALAKASTYAGSVGQSRILMSLQLAGHPVLWPLLAVLVFWALALFFAIGMSSRFNAAVVITLAFGAISVGFALFLIVELVQPYTGLVKVSPGALREAIEYMGK